MTTADLDAWLDGLVPAALEREQIAGAVVAVVHRGEVVTERGFGLADTGADGDGVVAVDPAETLFRIGSISKLVTATTVMQLVEAGQLDLDEPVQTYLDFDLPTRFETAVTLRHMLSHTAGFEDRIAGVIGDPTEAVPSLRDVVSRDVPEQIFEPGTTPAYSNYANALAAYVVQRVSGTDFADYASSHVFAPAGMDTATYAQPLPADIRATMSKGYDSTRSDEVPFEMVGPAPAGAISASASDMSSFMLAQLGHGPAPIMSSRTREQMQAPALEEDAIGGLARGPRMTLGYFERDRNGHRVLGHGGDLTAFHSQLDLYPDDDTGIYIALNSTGINPDSTTALRDGLSAGFADRYFPDQRPDPEPTATAAEHAAQVAGTYQLSRRAESTFVRLFFIVSAVTAETGPDNTLQISAVTDASGTPVDLVEVEPWVWQEVGGQRRVAVDQVDGRVTAVGLDPAFTLQPMPAHRAALPAIAAPSVGILVLFLIATSGRRLTRAVTNRRARRTAGAAPARASSTARADLLAMAACAALVPAAMLWAVVATALLNDAPPPSTIVIRSAQAFTALAVAGLIPASWRLADTSRRVARDGARRHLVSLVGALVVAAAFAGLAYTAVIGGMLSYSTTY